MLRLKSGNTHVAIAPHRGAIVTSFRVDERDLLYLDEATFNDHSKNVRGGIPILFPTPGKLENDRWSRTGRSGELKQHGFARNADWQIDATSPSSAVLSMHSNDETRRAYPWDFAAQLTYRVAPRELRIEFEIKNESDAPMPFAFGLHPYFAVLDKTSARIPTRASRAFDNVTKTIVPFSDFDFTCDEVDLHLIDHDSTHAELQLGDGARITIDTATEFVRWIVWTLAGKEYVCLEPWTAPGNALNSAEGLLVLEPQESRVLWTRIALEDGRA
jgi:galactose mutarotase-like enzyme